jgi:hypothetical protein
MSQYRNAARVPDNCDCSVKRTPVSPHENSPAFSQMSLERFLPVFADPPVDQEIGDMATSERNAGQLVQVRHQTRMVQ